MITSRRDYLLRMIDEITRMIARIVFKRRGGADQEALEIVVQGFERLFNLDRNQVFQFTPDQQFAMLTLDEPPEIARDKVLLYAALSAEAGWTYHKMGQQRMATATFMNAVRFALRSRAYQVDTPLPDYAPKVEDLVAMIGDDRLDPDVAEMWTRQKP
jgi:hypothetical protein